MKITLKELECLIKSKHYPKIKTPTGFELITDTYRKISKGVHLKFYDGDEIKASVLHLVYFNNSWVYIDKFKVGDIIENKLIIQKISLGEQEWVDFTVAAPHESYYHCGVLHHNSGKSLIVGTICRYITEVLSKKVLIVVPTIGLTTQMKSDFADYFGHTGWSADESVHLITAGVDKNIDKPVTISTFQSIYKMDSKWLNQFGAIIADEAHRVIAKTITGIFEKATNVEYKLGCTGTLHDMKCNLLVMKGITGPSHEIISTKDLIQNKQLVPLNIKAIVLKYPPEVCKLMKKIQYEDEINFICSHQKRLSFVANLALKCVGTTLVLFRFVDKMGMPLYNMIKERSTSDRPIYYIDGGVTVADREDIRIDSNSEDSIIIASQPTMSTGINLPAIENIIYAHPTKSSITVVQSLGRGLRLKEGKSSCTLYDLSDNFSSGQFVNTTYKHLSERLTTYTKLGFSFKIINLDF